MDAERFLNARERPFVQYLLRSLVQTVAGGQNGPDVGVDPAHDHKRNAAIHWSMVQAMEPTHKLPFQRK